MMMSAHDLAVAALNEVVAVVPRPENGVSSSFATAGNMDDATNATVVKPDNGILTSSQISNAALESASSHNSQSTVPDGETPPSSSFSSQSQDQGPQAYGPHAQIAPSVPLPHSNDTGVPPLTVATNAGQKRTIDGYVRRQSVSSLSRGTMPNYNGRHSRNPSAASAVSSATSPRELTSELRTRLSYAMVKVNKGWESLPIYEVESLTSQTGSPTSSTSTINGRRNLLASPRAAIASRQGLSAASPQPCLTTTTSNEPRESITFADGQPSSRTYESFWREQSQRQIGLSASLSSPSSSQLSLQPSAELSCTSRPVPHYRRSPPKSSKPTMLYTGISDISQSNLSDGAAPSTPGQGTRTPHRADSVLQTPTQKSLQEQDAIETLLFMSSPGNPLLGNFSATQSPLKAEFGVERRTEEESSVTPRAYETGTMRYRGRRRIGGVDVGKGTRRLRDDELDRMLDTMADTESSDDEIELPTTPMRATMGRV